SIWIYRLPSLIGAIGAVLATYWCALAFVSQRGALLAALMMMTSSILGVEARLAKTDAVLLFTVVVAMAVLARVYLAPRRGDPQPGLGQLAVFWTALAVGILIKGPMILMVVGLAAATLVVLDRSARWLLALRPLSGLFWLLLLVLPWFIAIYARVGGTIRKAPNAHSHARPKAWFSWRSESMASSFRRSNRLFPASHWRKCCATRHALLRSRPAPAMKNPVWSFSPAPRRTLPMLRVP